MLCFGISTPAVEHIQFQADGEDDAATTAVCVRAIRLIGVESAKWNIGVRALGPFGPRIVRQIEEMGGTVLPLEPDRAVGGLPRVFSQSYIGGFGSLDAGISAYLALQAEGRVALWPARGSSRVPADCLEWLDRDPAVPKDILRISKVMLVRFFDTDCFGLMFGSTADGAAAPEVAARIAQEFSWVSLCDDYLY